MKGKRLYHLVAERIKELILNGTYPPGSRLPGERELAEQFEVSRVTIREAEIALQALGYLDIKTGSGVYVLDAANVRTPGLPNTSAFELTEARLAFESEAASLAARYIMTRPWTGYRYSSTRCRRMVRTIMSRFNKPTVNST